MLGLADVAALLADRTRARMLDELMGGEPLPAGALGAALLSTALEHRWVERRPGGRALCVTRTGHRWLLGLGVELPPAQPRY